MKVKLRTLYAGPLGVYQPDSIVDIDAETARDLVATGHAVSCEPQEIEHAVLPENDVENTSMPSPAVRKKTARA